MSNDTKSRATTEQMICLNGFLKQYLPLLSGKFSSIFTFKTAQKRWEAIAESLNAMPGAVKDWKKWRKTFQDNRTKTKTKQSALQSTQKKTGYNTPCTQLSVVENDTLELINPTSLSGHTESLASKVIFSFDDDMLESNNNYDTIEQLNMRNESPELFSDEIQMDDNVVVVNSPSSVEEHCTTIIPYDQPNKKDKTFKPKKTTTAKRLEDSNNSAASLVVLGEKKLKVKSDYLFI